MPAGTYLQSLSSTLYSYVLTIGAQPVQDKVPLNGDGVTPLTFTLSGENQTGQATFTIEDKDSTFSLAFGGEVQIKDTRNGGDTIVWGGVLVEANLETRPSNAGRMITCTALSYDCWLDWKIVDRFVSKNDVPTVSLKNGEKRWYKNDDDVILQLFSDYGGDQQPVVAKKNYNGVSDWMKTNSNMPNLEIMGVTMREALQQVADTATTESDSTNRFFYVDETRLFHYYKDKESLVAPYYVTDDIYTRRVLNTTGLVSLWRMTDKSGTTATDSKGYAAGTYNGGISLNVTSGVINEPYLTAASFDGTTAYMSATGASLHPGDTFTVELWFKRSTTGTLQSLWSGGTNDVEIGFDASNKLVVSKEGVGANFTSTPAYTDTDWHHLVVTRSPGTTTVYIDGSAVAGTTVAQTFAAAAGNINIGRRVSASDRFFSGTIACAAIYSTNIGAVEAMRHCTIGDGVNPVNLRVGLAAYDGRERVYVAGKNKAGSGWVSVRNWNQDTTFGRAQYGRGSQVAFRDALVDRPESDTKERKLGIGTAWLRRHDDPRATASFSVTGYNGWKPGQKIYIYNRALGCIVRDNNGNYADDGRGVAFEITDVQADVSLGNGVITYNITCGPRFLRGSRILSRSKRAE